MENDTTLYLAYGSNMNVGQMAHRCPNATPLGGFYLPDYRLVFRGVADIDRSEGDAVPVALWKVTEECLASLDIYEGVESGLYERINLGHYFEPNAFMTYSMKSVAIRRPSKWYYNTIHEGYKDFGLSTDFLKNARTHSVENETVVRYNNYLGDRRGEWWYNTT